MGLFTSFFTMAVVLVGSALTIVVSRFESVEDAFIKNIFAASFSMVLFFIGLLAKRVDHDKKFTRFNVQTTRVLFLSCFVLLGFLVFNVPVLWLIVFMACDIFIIVISSYYFFIKSITNDNCPYRVRPENRNDYTRISRILRDAFNEEKFKNDNEQSLVIKLRSDESYIPKLALVFEDVLGEEIGYCMFSKVYAGSEKGQNSEVVVKDKMVFLSSMALSPEYKKKGLEKIFMKKIEEAALEYGYNIIILVGDEDYFKKFGYECITNYNINISFNLKNVKCLGKFLKEGTFNGLGEEIHISNILSEEYFLEKVSISL